MEAKNIVFYVDNELCKIQNVKNGLSLLYSWLLTIQLNSLIMSNFLSMSNE